ncbi:uncharacterized protein LOC143885613 [Tasmannia lanceolata]|uniref:uncharacterized protein LOC143885613 n=1 Tax=Tasmannia lanceolata TaxID=3420 RepID=UPI0040628397
MTDHSNIEEHNDRQLDREIKEMVTKLTQRLTDLQSTTKFGSSHHHNDEDDAQHGTRIITLAGNNSGATMRADLGEKFKSSEEHELDMLGTCVVNSNFQAANNSIMLSGSYTSHDPGVHMVISDYVEEYMEHEHEHEHDHKKGKKTEKKKEKHLDVLHETKSDGDE